MALTPEDDDATAADCVGCLRTAHARYPEDPDLKRLVAELRAGSERFDRLWRAGRSGQVRTTAITVRHPGLGRLDFDCDVLLVPEADQTLVAYSPAPATPECRVPDGRSRRAPGRLISRSSTRGRPG
jgi:hypothetical protein